MIWPFQWRPRVRLRTVALVVLVIALTAIVGSYLFLVAVPAVTGRDAW